MSLSINGNPVSLREASDGEKRFSRSSQMSTLPIRTTNFSIIGNPFAEIDSSAWMDADFVKKLVDRTGFDNILRIDQHRKAFPVDGINIFDVLCSKLSKFGSAGVDCYAEKLREVFKRRNGSHFNILVRHLFVEKGYRCNICNEKFGKVDNLIRHIMGNPHVKQMESRQMGYPMKALAFWMLSLRIAENNAPWWLEEEKREARREETISPPIKSSIKSNSVVVKNNPTSSSMELGEINLALMRNPFTEYCKVARLGDKTFVDKLVRRTAIERILIIDINHRAVAIDDVDPSKLLRRVPAPEGLEKDAVRRYASKLFQLFNKTDIKRLHILVGYLFLAPLKRHCALCEGIIIRTPSELIEHIISEDHTDKMRKHNQAYASKALAYWMIVLKIAQENAPWWLQKKMEVEVMHKPKTQLPVATSASDAVVEEEEKQPQNKPSNPGSALALFYHFTEVPNPCTNLPVLVSFMERKLASGVVIRRVKRCYKLRWTGKMLHCTICPSDKIEYFGNPHRAITHILGKRHLKELLRNGGQVDMDAIFFWFDILMDASTSTNQARAAPRNPTNRLLVAGMIDPSSPLALLSHCEKVPHPFPNYEEAVSILDAKRQQVDIKLFNKAMDKLFREETRLCGVCLEYKPLRNANDFIVHVASKKHIANATSNGGQVSKEAILLWLTAFKDAGASILPGEKVQVSMLFEVD